MSDLDTQVRTAASNWLKEKTLFYGDVLDRKLLAQGFDFKGARVPLLGPQGIFKPKILPELPISITTTAPKPGKERPYDDEIDDLGRLRYRYQGTNPDLHTNVALRKTIAAHAPLIYFYGIVEGRYLPWWPVYVVADHPGEFCVSVDMGESPLPDAEPADIPDDIRRRYRTVAVKHRLHQSSFRERVLHAYKDQCALCRLHHQELLEAAHILPDSHPKGEPTVRNGLALCKLHHAAYDRNILGIRPDLKVEVRLDILKEIDGPMLEHGLQHFHGKVIWTPRGSDQKPNPVFLAERFQAFTANR